MKFKNNLSKGDESCRLAGRDVRRSAERRKNAFTLNTRHNFRLFFRQSLFFFAQSALGGKYLSILCLRWNWLKSFLQKSFYYFIHSAVVLLVNSSKF